jgi:hypothetical protein
MHVKVTRARFPSREIEHHEGASRDTESCTMQKHVDVCVSLNDNCNRPTANGQLMAEVAQT